MQPQYQPNYGINPQAIPQPRLGQFGIPVTQGQHTAPHPQTLKVEETVGSASQDSFVVKDMTNSLRYKVDGSFTINERKTMTDMHGRVLLKIKEARMQMREKITISDAAGVPVVTIREAGMGMGAKKANGFVGGIASGMPAFVITGTSNKTNFRITDANGMELAVVHRAANSLKTRLTGQDSYQLTVMPNVDAALMSMITVSIDEIWCD
jgi:uncharacterized protein YxjI